MEAVAKQFFQKNSAQKIRLNWTFKAVPGRIFLRFRLLICEICYCKFILQQPHLFSGFNIRHD